MPRMTMAVDVDALVTIAKELAGNASALEDAEHPEDLAAALERVRKVAESDLPEWLEDARRKLREFAAALG